MDHPHENMMHLPASYAVLSEEEMTYLDGGKQIVLAHFGTKDLLLDTEVFHEFLISVAVNSGVMLTAASFNYISNLWQAGTNNGLSAGGTFHHTWDKLATPWSRIAAVGVASLAGVYVYSKAMSVYRNVKSIYENLSNTAFPDFSEAQTAAA